MSSVFDPEHLTQKGAPREGKEMTEEQINTGNTRILLDIRINI